MEDSENPAISRIDLPYATISLDQFERIAKRMGEVPGVRWEWRANDVPTAEGRQLVESSPTALFDKLREGRIQPESIGIEAFPLEDTQWVEGRSRFEIRAPDGVRYHFQFRVGINRKRKKQNYVTHQPDVEYAIHLADDVRKILSEYPRRGRTKFLLRRRGEFRFGTTHQWTVAGVLVAVVFGIAAVALALRDEGKSESSGKAPPAKSVADPMVEECLTTNTGSATIATIATRLGRTDVEELKRLKRAVAAAIRKECEDPGVESNTARLEVVCGRGYTSKPVTYCSAFDLETEPAAAVTPSHAKAALQAAGLMQVSVRPTTESFSTVVFDNEIAANDATDTDAICNVVFFDFVGPQDNTHADAMRQRLENECRERGAVRLDFVASATSALTREGSPNCCMPSYPRPESLSDAVIIGGGGKAAAQLAIGIARVIVFPDQLTTNDYLSWYEQASADGGEGGFMSDPILRVCNSVVLAGGGVTSQDVRASAKDLMKVARELAAHCPDEDGAPMEVESIGGKIGKG